MRSTKEALQQVDQTTEEYIRELESHSMEQLRWKPSESEWSVGQVIQHLIQSAHGMQLGNAVACMGEEATEPSTLSASRAATAAATGTSPIIAPTAPAGKTQVGETIFATGGLPTLPDL